MKSYIASSAHEMRDCVEKNVSALYLLEERLSRSDRSDMLALADFASYLRANIYYIAAERFMLARDRILFTRDDALDMLAALAEHYETPKPATVVACFMAMLVTSDSVFDRDEAALHAMRTLRYLEASDEIEGLAWPSLRHWINDRL